MKYLLTSFLAILAFGFTCSLLQPESSASQAQQEKPAAAEPPTSMPAPEPLYDPAVQELLTKIHFGAVFEDVCREGAFDCTQTKKLGRYAVKTAGLEATLDFALNGRLYAAEVPLKTPSRWSAKVLHRMATDLGLPAGSAFESQSPDGNTLTLIADGCEAELSHFLGLTTFRAADYQVLDQLVARLTKEKRLALHHPTVPSLTIGASSVNDPALKDFGCRRTDWIKGLTECRRFDDGYETMYMRFIAADGVVTSASVLEHHVKRKLAPILKPVNPNLQPISGQGRWAVDGDPRLGVVTAYANNEGTFVSVDAPEELALLLEHRERLKVEESRAAAARESAARAQKEAELGFRTEFR